jgi:ATP-dependent DNA helicase RecG
VDDGELEELLRDKESDRMECKESDSDPGRIREAICAFANDMPGHNRPGVIFIGIKDDGSCANLDINDELLLKLSDMRSSGNILPIPGMDVQKRRINGCEAAVIIVHPSSNPPVRYNGRTRIRVGPRRATATLEEEQRLSEKRRARDIPYDLHPLSSASLDDLDVKLFKGVYLSCAVAPEIIRENRRTVEDQMLSLHLLSRVDGGILPLAPTVTGILTIGKSPADYIPGAYVQFLRIDGVELSDPIADQKQIHGPLPELIPRIDEIFKANIHIKTDISSSSIELRYPDYPLNALQQLVRNAVMHRTYESSNAPVRITWFSDRVEIQNPGGPYGQCTVSNFGAPGITDYRNRFVASAMSNLGFVQQFGVGIQIARKALKDNGNPAPVFDVQDNHIMVTVRRRP